MSEEMKSEAISRRSAFSLLGLGAALSLLVPVVTVSSADAQTPGMVRRHERREHRHERRHERREHRHERREHRHGA